MNLLHTLAAVKPYMLFGNCSEGKQLSRSRLLQIFLVVPLVISFHFGLFQAPVGKYSSSFLQKGHAVLRRWDFFCFFLHTGKMQDFELLELLW